MKGLFTIALFALIMVIVGGNMMFVSALELQKTRKGYSAEVKIPSVTINSTENGYVGLSIRGYYYNNPVGMPALPERMFRLAIGKNKIVPQISVTVLETETIALSAKLHPVQEDYPDNVPISSRTFHIDRDFYTTSGTKEPLVSVSESFVCHGVPGVEVSIRPVSYNPLQNRVTVAKKIRLDIEPDHKSPRFMAHVGAIGEAGRDFAARRASHRTNRFPPTGLIDSLTGMYIPHD